MRALFDRFISSVDKNFLKIIIYSIKIRRHYHNNGGCDCISFECLVGSIGDLVSSTEAHVSSVGPLVSSTGARVSFIGALGSSICAPVSYIGVNSTLTVL